MADDFKDLEQKIKITYDTNAEQVSKKTDELADNTEKVATASKEVTKATKENSEANKELSGTLDKISGGALSAFDSMKKGLATAANGFKTLRGAIISTGIGALVILITSVAAAFSSSEEGQNKFAKMMAVIGSVVGNVMDVLSDLGEIIIGIFSGDSKAIKSAKDFGKKFFDVVGLPIKNVIEIVKTAGAVLGSLFSGDIKGALENLEKGAKGIKSNFQDAGNAINGAKNALKEFGEEALKEAKIAAQIADQRAKADKTERDLIVKRAEADRKRAELLEKAQQRDKYNVKERTKFLQEASKVEEEITNKEIEAAKLRRDAIIEENKLSKSNKEALKAEEEAKAKVIQLETAKLSKQKEVTGQISGLIEQEKAEQKALLEAKKKLWEEEKAKREAILNELKALEENYNNSIEDLTDKTEEEKLARQKERDLENISRLEQQGVDVTEVLKLNAEKYSILERELADKKAEQEREANQKRIDDRNAFDEQYYTGIREFADAQNEAELEQVRAYKEKLIEIEREAAIRKIEADGGTAEEIAEKKLAAQLYYDDLELQNYKAVEDAKLAHKQEVNQQLDALGQQGFATAKMLFEKNKGVQKGLLIAENAIGLAKVGINTATGISKAMSKGVAGIPEAAIVGASGVLSAVNIVAATKKGLKALGGGDAGGGGGETAQRIGAASQPQTGFQASSENQIATSVTNAQRDTPPVQAYVVSQEVTTAQSIDRNRIEGNSF